MAPARVLDSDLKKEFTDNFTKIQVKYVDIDPKITPTDEQVKAEYDKDPTKYQITEKRDAEFVAISLVPPRPPIVDDLITRARNNEDFAELAKKNSQGPDAQSGGAMGWTEQGPNDADYLTPLFQVPVGGVSDAIESGGAYYIYKVEEEKTSEATGGRSVNARRIVIRPKLEDAERTAREEKASAIAAKAKESKDLAAAAAEAGVSVAATLGVGADSTTAENLAPEDVRAFAKDLGAVEDGAVSDVIKARMNLYVAKVTKVTPPVAQPLEAVRDKAVADAIESIRRSSERQEEVKKLSEEIAAAAHSLPGIVAKYPQLNLEIKESKEFTRKDYLFSEGLMVQTVDVYAALGAKDPGAFAGPIRGFRGNQYFVELMKKTPPTDENWANDWSKEEPQLRRMALASKRNQLLSDYLAHLRELTNRTMPIQRDFVAIAKVLGTDREESDQAAAEDEKAAEKEKGAEKEKPAPVQHAPVKPAQGVDFGPPASE